MFTPRRWRWRIEMLDVQTGESQIELGYWPSRRYAQRVVDRRKRADAASHFNVEPTPGPLAE